MSFEDAMIEAVERGDCTDDNAYDYVRDAQAEAAERDDDEPARGDHDHRESS